MGALGTGHWALGNALGQFQATTGLLGGGGVSKAGGIAFPANKQDVQPPSLDSFDAACETEAPNVFRVLKLELE